ncbi:MAG: intein-containing RctB family protein [Armatimonadota bacterium]
MSEKWEGKLERIDTYRWRIPKDYKKGMRVDGIIYASAQLIEHIVQDQSPEQVANVATLPGIQSYSIAMPDIHWGYGFPIGGVAAMDIKEGVVSPGGVGFDINCLTADTRVLCEHGYTLTLGDLEHQWDREAVVCQRTEERRTEPAPIGAYIKARADNPVYELRTLAGDTVRASAEHPFLTPQGMKRLEELQPGDQIAMYPFEGVPYEPPSDEVIVDEGDIARLLNELGDPHAGNRMGQVLRQLRRLNLLPLRYSSPALPYLIKLVGYVMGDGTLYFPSNSGKGVCWFYGEAEDLEDIRRDLQRIGFTPSQVYRRVRHHAIVKPPQEVRFEYEECSFKVVGSSFALLMMALGVPVGQKTAQAYDVPCWLQRAPLWQKRLFLAALFGAEMNAPAALPVHQHHFQYPMLSMSKRPEQAGSGRRFLLQVANLLQEFGVEVHPLREETESMNPQGDLSVRFKLMVRNTPENLLRLWARVGFEYNRSRHALANVAVQYLKHKIWVVQMRRQASLLARQMHQEGKSVGELAGALQSHGVNHRLVEHSISERVSKDFPTFPEYLQMATAGIEGSGMVWERVASIAPVSGVEEVYDLTVLHPDHNFVANGFVVSNCGVRMLRTDLTIEEVQPRIKELVDQIFRDVPAGLKGEGLIKVNPQELREVMRKGAIWMVEHGYGWEEDIERSEQSTTLTGLLPPEPSNISNRAIERGKTQLGTLGGGNHFLEVQVVDEIYDAEVAEAFGITQVGQITVMIHTGSRGFGHQTCDDYLDVMQRAQKKYGIELPDRQLACAPITSEEGEDYLTAMACAANFAWANRQAIAHWVRQAFAKVFGSKPQQLGMHQIYDVAHNIAKIEEHEINGKVKAVCVHRKGATRAFGPGHPAVPEVYRHVGQPVLIPGDMGRYSFILVGTVTAMRETFGSTCHGAGRMMSRHGAMREAQGRNIAQELAEKGIYVRAQNKGTLAEEASYAYKDVANVVDVCEGVGISRKVARMRPIGVVKG